MMFDQYLNQMQKVSEQQIRSVAHQMAEVTLDQTVSPASQKHLMRVDGCEGKEFYPFEKTKERVLKLKALQRL
jgi:hypothetical protein